MALQLTNQLPRDIIVPPRTTTSASILRTNLMEFLPENIASYSPRAFNIITFNVADANSFLRFSESYFTWKLEIPTGATVTPALVRELILDTVGVHALIRSVTITTQDGVEISRFDNYNRIVALESILSSDRDDIEYNMFDSAEQPYEGRFDDYSKGFYYLTRSTDGGSFKVALADAQNLTFIASSTKVTTEAKAEDANFLAELAAGDIIEAFLNESTADNINRYASHKFYVVAVASNQSATVQPLKNDGGTWNVLSGQVAIQSTAGPAGTHVVYEAARVYKHGMKYPGNDVLQPERKIDDLGNSETFRKMAFQIKIPLFQQTFPIWLIPGGIRIAIELEQPARAFYSNIRWTADQVAALDYKIVQPRFWGKILSVAPEIQTEFEQMWNGEEGLVYYLPQVRSLIVAASDTSNAAQQVSIGKRSARKAFVTILSSTYSIGNTNDTLYAPSLSTFLRWTLSRYQLQIGAHLFPLRYVEVTDNAAESFMQLKLNAQLQRFRFKHEDWIQKGRRLRFGHTAQVIDSTKFILSFDFLRDSGPDSQLTGVDVSLVHAELLAEFKSTFQNAQHLGSPTYHFMVAFDNYVRLRAADGVVRID